jgi:hypothetical protein
LYEVNAGGMLFQHVATPLYPSPMISIKKSEIVAGFTSPSIYMPIEVSKLGSHAVLGGEPNISVQTTVKKTSSTRRPSDIIRRILADEGSSESESAENVDPFLQSSGFVVNKEERSSDRDKKQIGTPHSLKAENPALDGTSQVLMPQARLPIRNPKPRDKRINKKMEELEKVQQFVEESKAVQARIHAGLEPLGVSQRTTELLPRQTLGATTTFGTNQELEASHRSHSHTQEANNIAQLRRNIADKYTKSPLSKLQPPVAS